MSTKSCQVARYLIPPSSMTSFGNLGCMPNRHLDYCKNSGEVCVTECHWSVLLERRGVRTDLWYQCGNKQVRAQTAKVANVMAIVVRGDERARYHFRLKDYFIIWKETKRAGIRVIYRKCNVRTDL